MYKLDSPFLFLVYYYFLNYLVDQPLLAADISEDNARGGEIVRKINICASLSQGHYHPIFQQARKAFIYFIILWLVFYTYNMFGEKEKQVVSARANDANKLIDWLIFFYWNCDSTSAWQAVISKWTLATPHESKLEKAALLVYILQTALFENYSNKTFRMDK